MVIAPANTGRDNNNKNAVINTLQTKRGILKISIPLSLILIIVVIKFIAPAIEEAPAKCKLNIDKSTAGPEWANMLERGGYMVQPVPTPDSTQLDKSNKIKDGGNNQKLKLLSLGKAISGEPINIGTKILPKAPIIKGITIKKIIIRP
jgi:hypothetical protein